MTTQLGLDVVQLVKFIAFFFPFQVPGATCLLTQLGLDVVKFVKCVALFFFHARDGLMPFLDVAIQDSFRTRDPKYLPNEYARSYASCGPSNSEYFHDQHASSHCGAPVPWRAAWPSSTSHVSYQHLHNQHRHRPGATQEYFCNCCCTTSASASLVLPHVASSCKYFHNLRFFNN